MQKNLLLDGMAFGTNVPNPFHVSVFGFFCVAPARPGHTRAAHLLRHMHEEMKLWIHAVACSHVMEHEISGKSAPLHEPILIEFVSVIDLEDCRQLFQRFPAVSANSIVLEELACQTQSEREKPASLRSFRLEFGVLLDPYLSQ